MNTYSIKFIGPSRFDCQSSIDRDIFFKILLKATLYFTFLSILNSMLKTGIFSASISDTPLKFLLRIPCINKQSVYNYPGLTVCLSMFKRHRYLYFYKGFYIMKAGHLHLVRLSTHDYFVLCYL